MEELVFIGFTSHQNDIWISFGPPTYKEFGGHPIGWELLGESKSHSNQPSVQAAVQLRQRIIIRTGQAPDITNANVDNMLLKLVQLALKDNLV